MDSHSHIFRFEPQYAGESRLLAELVKPRMQVLDVGTAATGRSARMLTRHGCRVYSIEINLGAILEFAQRADSKGIYLTAADMCQLPFVDGCFDLVLVAFHGLDYLLTNELRQIAFQEIARVLNQQGTLIFNTCNRLGILLTPSSLLSKEHLRHRARHILSGRFLKPTLIDTNNLELYQSMPSTNIRLVQTVTDLKFKFMTSMSGRSRNRIVNSLLAVAPYYVFSRTSIREF